MPYKCPVKYAAYHAEYRKKNREKIRENSRRSRTLHPESAEVLRNRKLKSKYGIGLADFNRMLLAQGKRCAICKSDKPGTKGWCVDHDHTSGKVRLILCNNCNNGLGHFKDDPALLRAAADYIVEHANVAL